MFIKSVDVHVRDIFLGKGWENWIRYSKASGHWKRIGGLGPNYETEQQILKRLDSWGTNRKEKHK